MRTSVLVTILLAVAAASVIPTERKIADRELLLKQKYLLQILVRVHQPNMFTELKTIGDNYDIEANLANYKYDAGKNFITYFKKGMLARGEIFSVLYEPHMEQAIKLFDMFYYANNWDTFFRTACWARDRVNEGQFVYALAVAVLHRPDTKDLVMPSIYEITPHLFVDAETIQKAYEARMEGSTTITDERKEVVIPTKWTTMWHTLNPEKQLSYFTEDVGLSAYYTYFHLMYPFWMTAKNYGLEFQRYGELFYYTQQQLLARYNLERLSVGLPEVDVLLFDKPIKTGYSSTLRYQNGLEVPTRPDNIIIQDEDRIRVQEIEDIERRFREAIDLGYMIAEDGSKVSIFEFNGIDILGKTMESLGQSVNRRYYGNLFHTLKTLVSRVVDPIHKHAVAPGALENFRTAVRDPAFFQACRRIDVIFRKYKESLGYYSQDELAFPGVRIEKVEVDKLVTYFDNFDIDLMNAINVNNVEEARRMYIVARQQRLTYKPFTYNVTVNSDKDTNMMVRVFLGPKYDISGQEMNLNTMRRYMIEIDRFPYRVVAGKNVVERNSHDSTVTVWDHPTYRTMMNKVEDGLSGKTVHVDEITNYCGYPDRLLLPKGTKNGLPLTMFVMVTNYDGPMTNLPTAFVSCGVGYNAVYPDVKPMGFPFDRAIKNYDFVTPNMFWKDVLIFHKKSGDLSIQQ